MRLKSFEILKISDGFSLIETVLTIGLIGGLILAGAQVLGTDFFRTSNVATSISQFQIQLIHVLNNEKALSKTAEASRNRGSLSAPKMECLVNGTACTIDGSVGGTPIRDQLMALYDASGTLIYDATDLTAGLTINGVPCTGFDASLGNDSCPLRINLTWSPVCAMGACTNVSQLKVSSNIIYKPQSQRQNINLNWQNNSYEISLNFSDLGCRMPPAFVETGDCTTDVAALEAFLNSTQFRPGKNCGVCTPNAAWDINCTPANMSGTVVQSGDQISNNGTYVTLNPGVHIPRPGYLFSGNSWITGSFQLTGGGGGLLLYGPGSDIGDASANGVMIRARSVRSAIGNYMRVVATNTLGAIQGGGGGIIAKATHIDNVLGANGICVAADTITYAVGGGGGGMKIVNKTVGLKVNIGTLDLTQTGGAELRNAHVDNLIIPNLFVIQPMRFIQFNVTYTNLTVVP